MKALVIWESLTGTTRRAAHLLAGGLRANGIETAVCPAANVDHGALSAADIVVVGSWTDGMVFIGQKPGRPSRLRNLPVLTGKQAYVYCTYALDAGNAVEKLGWIVKDLGAEVVAGQQVHRFHLERDCNALLEKIVARVPSG